ncbi:MAG: hypothetical protein ACM3ZV_06900 [Bacillota bacterium]
MKYSFLLAAGAFALATGAAPAAAQMTNMPGMSMPAPAKKAEPRKKKKPAKPVKAAARKTAPAPAHKHAAKKEGAPSNPAVKNDGAPSAHESMSMAMPGADVHEQHGTMPAQQPGEPMAMPMPQGHSPADHAGMGPMAMPASGHMAHEMAMTGALGPYPMQRESSGTAWQPDESAHVGAMSMSGRWTLMAHGVLNLVYDHQSGRRGDDKAFASGMLMGMAQHPLGNGTVQLKAMLSPDPLMGPRGYPLLLASGETANGRDRLIDRQHPHDLFMELAGSVSQKIGPRSSLFVYAGLPGEPAFGPPAFMHREAIMDSPEAPITHHWLDSTHISFGVLTGGIVLDQVKIEASRFNAREPDQHRWDIETGPLDSTAVRVSWNPARTLSLQGSWGHFVDPEQLEPGVDQKRWSASALWADDVAPGWKAAATLAWGRKTAHGHSDDAFAAEGSLKHAGWTIFGRAEMAENRELTQLEHGPSYRVGKASVGAVRDFGIAEHLSLGAGGLVSVNRVPDALAPLYGGNSPAGAMGFVRLKLD